MNLEAYILLPILSLSLLLERSIEGKDSRIAIYIWKEGSGLFPAKRRVEECIVDIGGAGNFYVVENTRTRRSLRRRGAIDSRDPLH